MSVNLANCLFYSKGDNIETKEECSTCDNHGGPPQISLILKNTNMRHVRNTICLLRQSMISNFPAPPCSAMCIADWSYWF